jgi:TIR domain-containing protein
MRNVQRGPKRTAIPDIFVSHSSRDKPAAIQLARTLNFCSIDVWLDDWEIEVGQSLTDEIAKAMDASRYVAILADMGIAAFGVRHPSHGGQADFVDGIGSVYGFSPVRGREAQMSMFSGEAL